MSQTPPQMKKLGKYLKSLREELGLNMHDVARQTKLTPSYISKLEKGDNFSSIGVGTLVAFSKAYEIPITAIIENAGFIKSRSKNGLPCLGSYLKIKYSLSPEQVRDILIAFDITEKKYKK